MSHKVMKPVSQSEMGFFVYAGRGYTIEREAKRLGHNSKAATWILRLNRLSPNTLYHAP